MFDGRIKRIIAFLKEKFADETESSRQMLITYSDYLKGEADEESLERANQQLEEQWPRFLKMANKQMAALRFQML